MGKKFNFAHKIMIFDNLAILAHLRLIWQVGSREMVTMGLFDDLGAHEWYQWGPKTWPIIMLGHFRGKLGEKMGLEGQNGFKT